MHTGSDLERFPASAAGEDADLSPGLAHELALAEASLALLLCDRGAAMTASAASLRHESHQAASNSAAGRDEKQEVPQGLETAAPELLRRVTALAESAAGRWHTLAGQLQPASEAPAAVASLASLAAALVLHGLPTPRSAATRALLTVGVSCLHATADSRRDEAAAELRGLVAGALLWTPSFEGVAHAPWPSLSLPRPLLLDQRHLAVPLGPNLADPVSSALLRLWDCAAGGDPAPLQQAAWEAEAAAPVPVPCDSARARGPMARALLLRAAALLSLRRSDLPVAVAAATESLRHSSAAMARLTSQAATSTGIPGRAAATCAYLEGLLLLGELYERAHAPEDASHALLEGVTLARAVGSTPMQAAFCLALARLHASQRSWDRCENRVQQAEAAAGALPGGPCPVLRAELAMVRAHVALARSGPGPCLAALGQAEEHLAEVQARMADSELGERPEAAAQSIGTPAPARPPLRGLQASAAPAPRKHKQGTTGQPPAPVPLMAEGLTSHAPLAPWDLARWSAESTHLGLRRLRALALLAQGDAAGAAAAASEALPPGWGFSWDAGARRLAVSPDAGSQPLQPEAAELACCLLAAHLSLAGVSGRALGLESAEEARVLGLSRQEGLVSTDTIESALAAALALMRGAGSLPAVLRQCCQLAAAVADAAALPWSTAMFLHLGSGTGLRCQLAFVLESKLQRLRHADGGADSPGQSTLRALSEPLLRPLPLPLTPGKTRPGQLLQSLESAAQGWFAGAQRLLGPRQAVTALCVIRNPARILEWSDATGGAAERLVASRWVSGDGAPVTVSLPVGRSEESEDASPYLQSAGALRAHFFKLLQDSSRTMSKDEFPLDTAAQRQKWWRARLELDRRMGQMLRRLQAEWLGPWRRVPPRHRRLGLGCAAHRPLVLCRCLLSGPCPAVPAAEAGAALVGSCPAALQPLLQGAAGGAAAHLLAAAAASACSKGASAGLGVEEVGELLRCVLRSSDLAPAQQRAATAGGLEGVASAAWSRLVTAAGPAACRGADPSGPPAADTGGLVEVEAARQAQDHTAAAGYHGLPLVTPLPGTASKRVSRLVRRRPQTRMPGGMKGTAADPSRVPLCRRG